MMIEILIALAALVALGKHGKGKGRYRRYIRGAVDELTNIGTLASLVAVATPMDSVVNERTWASSLRAIWSVSNWTAAANVGPLLVGVAHSDYTAAEIEEWIEQTGSWDEGNLVSQEVGKRKIRTVGTLDATQAVTETVSLNDGKAITTKLGWILTQGQTLDVWAYNLGSAAFATTSPQLRTQGHVNLWPQ